MPLEMASNAVVDLTSIELANSESSLQVVHLINPKTQPAEAIFRMFSEKLGLRMVSYGEWVKLLVESLQGSADPKDVPASKLLEFLVEDSTDGVYGRLLMDGRKAERLCRTLGDASVRELNREDVGSWLRHWESIGFLPDTRRVSRL